MRSDDKRAKREEETPRWRDTPATSCGVMPWEEKGYEQSSTSNSTGETSAIVEASCKSQRLNPTATCTVKEPKLHAREREKKALLQAFQRAINPSEKVAATSELVLLTGISGSGKSSLVYWALREECVEKHKGFLITAKFDQLDRPENYAPIVSAFTELIEGVLRRDTITVRSFQRAANEAVEKQPLLIDMLPTLQDLLEADPTRKTTNIPQQRQVAPIIAPKDDGSNENDLCATATGALGQNTQERLSYAFQTLVKALRSTQYPIVLFTDDLQWAEPASLDLLAMIACDQQELSTPTSMSGALLLVGSCRHNEIVSASHPLSVMLRELETNQVQINQIALKNLDLKTVGQMVATDYIGDLEESDGVRYTCDKVADFVLRQTGGNALFVVLLLRFLQEEGLLQTYDNTDDEGWERRILESFDCTDAVRLVRRRLEHFDPSLQEILMVAACMGAEFHEALLEQIIETNVLSQSAVSIEEQLKLAEQKDLVQNVKPGTWRFTHDQVRRAAITLIPDEELNQLHLTIGTKLWKQLPNDELELHGFVVIGQLRLGAHLITNQDDRNQMASFLLSSAQAAVASSAFAAAASYVELGIKLLGERHWRDQYDLSLQLFNAAIEIEYCNGEYAKMDALTSELVRHARRKEDIYLAVSNGVLAWGVRGNFKKAIGMGMAMLRDDLGLSIPNDPGIPQMLWEFVKTKKLILKFSDENILNLTPMTDPAKLIAMRLMLLQFPYMINIRPILAIVVTMKMVRTFLKHGISTMTAPALSIFAMLLYDGFGEAALGTRFSNLSLVLLEKHQSREWLGRTYFAVYAFSLPHVQPWTASIKPLLVGHRVALATGDFEFALHIAALYLGISLGTGVPLDGLWNDIQVFLALGNARKQAKVDHFIRPTAQFTANLMGQSPNPTVLTGAFEDEEDYLKEARESAKETNVKVFLSLKLRLLSYFHRYEEGEAIALWLMQQPVEDLAVYTTVGIYLHSGLVVAGAARQSKSASWRRTFFVKKCLKKIKGVAKTASVEQGSMSLALEASLMTMQKRYVEADEQFQRALVSGKEQGFTDVVGVIHEHIADSQLIRGQCSASVESLRQARAAYEQWGATAKVQDVDERINQTGSK